VVGQKTRQWIKKTRSGGQKKAVENNTKNKVRVLKIQVVKINKVGCQKNRGMSKKTRWWVKKTRSGRQTKAVQNNTKNKVRGF
jgi:hypothetical protein